MSRDDFTKAQRDEWQRQRLREAVARGNVKASPNVMAFINKQPAPPKPPRTNAFADLTKQIEAGLKDLGLHIRGAVKDTLRETARPTRHVGQYLQADTSDSDCFEDLSYSRRDGGVYASFQNPTRGTWFYPMSRRDAEVWFDAESLGEFFNSFIRE